MAEKRKKEHSILLRTKGKSISLELFPSEEWPEENCGEGLFRVRINDAWHCPTGKYSFLTHSAISDLLITLLNPDALPEEDCPFLPYNADVTVYTDDFPYYCRGNVKVPPYQKRYGRWYAQVWIPGGVKEFCCSDITLRRVRG